MANYLSGNNISLDGDDIDDEYFLRSSRNNYNENKYLNGSSTNSMSQQWDLNNQNNDLLTKRLEIEDRTLKSTQRTLQHLRNSEFVGVATAEELLHQREQLERTGKSLDDINSTLKFSQRHIQGIKSVFGGLKNLISGKPQVPLKKPTNTKEEPQTSQSGSRLCTVLERETSSSSSRLHPALLLGDKYVEDSEELKITSPKQEVVNENMDQILESVKKLKELASGLGEEIDSQNDLIEGIIGKSERADRSLARQNKDLHKLL